MLIAILPVLLADFIVGTSERNAISEAARRNKSWLGGDTGLVLGAIALVVLALLFWVAFLRRRPTHQRGSLVVTRARKSIAQFKLREGMPIGAHVTLRGDRMWEFLDRLLSIALPRIRDFRGLSPKQFDGRGNYTFGLNEQSMFHEIDQDSIDRVRGMDITDRKSTRLNSSHRT